METTTTTSADRRDTHLADLVDQALAMSREHGTQAAARYLTDHGVDFALTVRVLAEPERRRSVTNQRPV